MGVGARVLGLDTCIVGHGECGEVCREVPLAGRPKPTILLIRIVPGHRFYEAYGMMG